MYATVHKTLPDDDFHQDRRDVRGFAALDIVGIAASAGGIPALKELLAALPEDFPCPIVVVQHLCSANQYMSALDQILSTRTRLRVKWAEDGESLRAGYILLAPQDQQIEINPDHKVQLVRAEKVNRVRPAADPLFASIAKHFGKRAVGVILSGALCDGAQGAYEIAAAGGRILVQNRETSLVPDMPAAAIRTGAVHFELTPAMIARALAALVMAPGAAEWFRVWPKALKAPMHTRARIPAALVGSGWSRVGAGGRCGWRDCHET